MLNSLTCMHTHTHTHTRTHTHMHSHTPTDDTKPVHLSAVFVSETGVVLSWQLPNIAKHSDVDLDCYSISYTRMGSGVFMTRSSQTPAIAISGLESNQTYVFRVSAIYSLPFLQSTEQSLTLTTQRKLRVLRLRVS